MKKNTSIKILFYGGLANNLYVTAKCLQNNGFNVNFIRDVSDHYVMSQPIWEDKKIVLNIAKNNIPKTSADWNVFEKKKKWRCPSWFIDIKLKNYSKNYLFSAKNKKSTIIRNKYFFKPQYKKLSFFQREVVEKMKYYDIVFVCGVEGAQLAFLSKRPYVIYPHGGDFRLAMGFPKLKFEISFNYFYEWVRRKEIATAFREANYILSPNGNPSQIVSLNSEEFINKKKILYFPTPVETRKRKKMEERLLIRRKIFKKFSIKLNPSNLTFFIPSRIDFYWKGHDKLINVIKNLPRDINFIFMNWGPDREKVISICKKKKINKQICFLNFIASKPVLYKFMDMSDAVIDQFKIGTCGTSTIESLAGSVPVLTYVNDDNYTKYKISQPPLINCKTEDDIESSINLIIKDSKYLERVSLEIKEWYKKTHKPENVSILMKEIVRKILFK